MPLPGANATQFQRYFQGWNRIEARSRSDNFALGLKATVADPLWMLGKQWTLQELSGADAGTAIDVKVQYQTVAMDHLKLGAKPRQPTGSIPVEVLVEREKVEWDWRLRVRVGQHFERLARRQSATEAPAWIEKVRAKCPVVAPTDPTEWNETDEATRRFLLLVAKRAIDGEALLKLINAGTLGVALPSALVTNLKKYYSRLYSQSDQPSSAAWRSEHLDYTFELSALKEDQPAIQARSYRNGELDWHSFTLTRSQTSKPRGKTAHLTPTHADYPGMPSRRWWEFEDSKIDLGELDIARTDLVKIMLTGALISADDAFVVPLTVPAGSVVSVLGELEILDSFGQLTKISPAQELPNDPLRRWQMYTLTATNVANGYSNFIYVPPVGGNREESAPIEEIRFIRDEGANQVWAVEHVVPSGLGEPTPGLEAHLELLRRQRGGAIRPASPPRDSKQPLKYVLATEVPANWIPFVPVATSTDSTQRALKLRRAKMISTDPDALSISPLSRLLDAGGVEVTWVLEQAVGREGANVELRRQRVRSADGETHVWLGRSIRVGKGEGRSGLTFDGLA
jgi:hypothetical protein